MEFEGHLRFRVSNVFFMSSGHRLLKKSLFRWSLASSLPPSALGVHRGLLHLWTILINLEGHHTKVNIIRGLVRVRNLRLLEPSDPRREETFVDPTTRQRICPPATHSDPEQVARILFAHNCAADSGLI